jgi:hypothetical protein
VDGQREGNSYNVLIPEGREKVITLRGPDVCKVSCPVRPYTRGYILVVDTPHFAATDAEGKFAIRGLPAGDYLVSVWHEVAGKRTKVGGATEVSVQPKRDFELNLSVKPPEPPGK